MTEDETPVLSSGRFVFAPNVDGGIDAAERAGAKPDAPATWGIRKGGEIVPLVPDFDPTAEDKDPAIETRFQEFLQSLGTVAAKPGEPVIVVKKTLYRFVEGFLDISEAPARLARRRQARCPRRRIRHPDRNRQGGNGADADRRAGRPRPGRAGKDRRQGRVRLSLRRPAVPARQGRQARLQQE
jgi:hypothetical protein